MSIKTIQARIDTIRKTASDDVKDLFESIEETISGPKKLTGRTLAEIDSFLTKLSK